MCTNPHFHDWLRQHREAAGFDSQRSFAKHASVDQSTVCKWESGTRQPSRGMLETIAGALGVPVRDVVDAWLGMADCA